VEIGALGLDLSVAAADPAFTGAFAAIDDPLNFGFVITTDSKSVSGNTLSQSNQTYYYRTLSGGVVGKIGFNVTTESGNIAVAVHENSGVGRSAVPGTQVASSGAVACPPAGYAEVALNTSVTVSKGDWLAISFDLGTTSLTGNAMAATALRDGIALRRSGHPTPTSGSFLTSARHFVLIGVP
jgi:hypothetical protein